MRIGRYEMVGTRCGVYNNINTLSVWNRNQRIQHAEWEVETLMRNKKVNTIDVE
jgi:hypothetical protein